MGGVLEGTEPLYLPVVMVVNVGSEELVECPGQDAEGSKVTACTADCMAYSLLLLLIHTHIVNVLGYASLNAVHPSYQAVILTHM